jgi:hypothetical protein
MSSRSERTRRGLFAVAAVALGAAALYHAYRLLVPDDSPSWRHALFVAIDGALAFGFVRRPRWFAVLFAAVVAQQLVSHGGAALRAASDGRTDLVSIAVIIGLPAMLILLLAEQRASRGRRDAH